MGNNLKEQVRKATKEAELMAKKSIMRKIVVSVDKDRIVVFSNDETIDVELLDLESASRSAHAELFDEQFARLEKWENSKSYKAIIDSKRL